MTGLWDVWHDLSDERMDAWWPRWKKRCGSLEEMAPAGGQNTPCAAAQRVNTFH
jgi:hypothetical protein